jgi:hypothetical protein
MGYAERIRQEIEGLPPDQQAQVLAFVVALKTPPLPAILPALSPDQEKRRDALLAFFAPFQADLSSYRFDREEASARR